MTKTNMKIPLHSNIYKVPYVTYSENDMILIDTLKTIGELKKIDKENPQGYALVDDEKIGTNQFPLLLEEKDGKNYFVSKITIDVLRDVCKHVKVFINNYEIANRGGHGKLNMASDESRQFYISIPHFEVKDGTIAEIKSDGYRAIVNIIK